PSGAVNPSWSWRTTAARWFGDRVHSAERTSCTSAGSMPGTGSGDGGGPRRSLLELPAGDPKGRPVDPGKGVTDLVPPFDGAGERLGHGVLRKVPPASGEPVDGAPQLRGRLSVQALDVTLDAFAELARRHRTLPHLSHCRPSPSHPTATEREDGTNVYPGRQGVSIRWRCERAVVGWMG